MERPDIEGKKREIDEWLDDEVYPYLESLLDKAQRKLRHKISFIDLGSFHVDTPWRRKLNGSPRRFGFNDFDYELKTEGSRIAKRFPELVEFNEIIDEISNELGLTIGGMLPTIKPRKRKKRGTIRRS